MYKKKNFAKSLTTNNPLAIGGTSLGVTTGEGVKFPAVGATNLFMGVIWGAAFATPEADPNREVVEAYQESTDTFTIVRAKESTSAKEWPQGSNFMLTATGGVFDEYDASLASETTSPGDTDLLGVWVSGILKKLTFANLKAVLKTYFDSLTTTLTNKTLSNGCKLDASADNNITQYGMARQAIMNGNFDVWQRGTSVSVVDVTKLFQADRWFDYVDKNGGTLPTITRSRQTLTPGDIANSTYFTRLNVNGAGTSLGVSSAGLYGHNIENGTSKLCGLNKKVTISFYAKSDIANKRICLTLVQNYGTGGSPTADEAIKGTPITLTNVWTKYTVTFTTNTLVGKTFGSNGDDYLGIRIPYIWGTTWGNTNVQTSVTAETFVGSGNIDIAQVQLCAGDVALPFQPKSFEEELRACLRYYEKSYEYGTVPGSAVNQGLCGQATPTATTANIEFPLKYQVEKMTAVTPTIYDLAGTAGKCYKGANGKAYIISESHTKGIRIVSNDATSASAFYFHFTVNAEL